MSIIGTIGLVGSLASMAYGAWRNAKSAKDAEKANAEAIGKQRAATEAWYNRNYYQDYMNTVQAQNALKNARKAWDDRVRSERARAAITGSTPEQAQAVAEAGGKAMGDLVGNLAAQGEASKQAVDAQKLAMDNNLTAQELAYKNAIAEQEQAAAADMISGGANLLTSSLQGVDGAKATKGAMRVNMPTDVKPLGEVATPVPTFDTPGTATTGMMDARVNGLVTPKKK